MDPFKGNMGGFLIHRATPNHPVVMDDHDDMHWATRGDDWGIPMTWGIETWTLKSMRFASKVEKTRRTD